MSLPVPHVSVVLPTHGRRASLLRVLDALGRQSLAADAFEVIVVCDGDVDGSAAACRAFAAEVPYTLRVFEQANQGPAVARNRGVTEARGPLIVFIDDDVVPDDGLLATHVRAQEGQDTRVTMGPLLPPRDARLNPWGDWEERVLCKQYDDMERGRWSATYRQFYTGNASILKRHIRDAGGFDPSFRRAEDIELALRLRDRGLHFVFLPQARGWHYVRRTLESWLRMPLAYGAADVAMARASRPWILDLIKGEFATRNATVRATSRLCAGRPWVARAALWSLGRLLTIAGSVGTTDISHGLCSLIFNLSYYHGLATALGGHSAFVALVRRYIDTGAEHAHISGQPPKGIDH